MYEDVLVTAGPDPNRKRTVEHAIELAATYGGRLHVIHVADLVDRGRLAEDEPLEEQGKEAIDRVEQAAQATDIETRTEIRSGTPYEEILDYVDEAGIDLVVMGTHGKSGLTRVLLGSTAEEVLRRSPVPVLTVRD